MSRGASVGGNAFWCAMVICLSFRARVASGNAIRIFSLSRRRDESSFIIRICRSQRTFVYLFAPTSFPGRHSIQIFRCIFNQQVFVILKWVFSVGDLIELVCNSIGAKTGPILNRADANGSIGSASIEEAPTRDRQPRGDVF